MNTAQPAQNIAGLPGPPPWQTPQHFIRTITGMLDAAGEFLTRPNYLAVLEASAAAIQARYDTALATPPPMAPPTAGDLANALQNVVTRWNVTIPLNPQPEAAR